MNCLTIDREPGVNEEPTPNLPTNIVDFRGFDSSTILNLRGGILMSIGDFPESLSQAMLVGVMFVEGLGVSDDTDDQGSPSHCHERAFSLLKRRHTIIVISTV